jgi:hypothetical protein
VTARRLAEFEGAFVRTHADGTAEVRTVEEGALHRYVVEPDGSVELVEIAPQSPRYAPGKFLLYAGFFIGIGSIIWGFAGEALRGLPALPASAVLAGAVLGLAVAVLGLAIVPRLSPPPGERWKHFSSPGGD